MRYGFICTSGDQSFFQGIMSMDSVMSGPIIFLTFRRCFGERPRTVTLLNSRGITIPPNATGMIASSWLIMLIRLRIYLDLVIYAHNRAAFD
jgi:hypothetical protein